MLRHRGHYSDFIFRILGGRTRPLGVRTCLGHWPIADCRLSNGQCLGQEQVIKRQPPGRPGVALAARRGAPGCWAVNGSLLADVVHCLLLNQPGAEPGAREDATLVAEPIRLIVA